MFRQKKVPANLRPKDEPVVEEKLEAISSLDHTATNHKGITVRTLKEKTDSSLDDVLIASTDGGLRNVDTQKVFTTLDVDTDKTHDHRAVLERNVELGKKLLSGELEGGIYRGQGAYMPHIEIREGALANAKFTGLYGPLRGSQYARTTLRIDYNPEICKDYKETGYCGFGDTCKFLHDRSDYKAGWQIDKEWEEAQKRKQKEHLHKKDGR